MSIPSIFFARVTRIFSLFVLVGIFASGCASSGGESTTDIKGLNDDEIRAAFTGKTYKYSGDSAGTQSWTTDKTEWDDNTWGPGEARWWAKDNQYCYFFEGKDTCSSVTLENGIYVAGLYRYDPSGGESATEIKGLTDDEIRAAFTGKTYKYSGDSKGTQSWTADKTEWNDNTWGPGKARWWAKDNKYCYFFEGKNNCSVVTVENGVYTAGIYKYDSN